MKRVMAQQGVRAQAGWGPCLRGKEARSSRERLVDIRERWKKKPYEG